jgi:NADH:ubiquinone oxidoreductase subunit 6 (subunit J)
MSLLCFGVFGVFCSAFHGVVVPTSSVMYSVLSLYGEVG